MKCDERAAEAKRQELRQIAATSHEILRLPADVQERILTAFSRVAPPEEGESEFTIGWITIDSIHSEPKANSRKPGNILLNWPKLIDIVPDISLAGLGAATLPIAPAIAAVLAGLYVWNKVWRGSIEEFSDVEAITILALWQNRDARNEIVESEGMKKTNELRETYALPSLSSTQFARAIDRLVAIDCIEVKNGVVWLREWIRVKYR